MTPTALPPAKGEAAKVQHEDDFRDELRWAYQAGARAVHDVYSTDYHPEFSEAAYDYADGRPVPWAEKGEAVAAQEGEGASEESGNDLTEYRCNKDGASCHVGKGTDDVHWRCGTSACGHGTTDRPPHLREEQPPRAGRREEAAAIAKAIFEAGEKYGRGTHPRGYSAGVAEGEALILSLLKGAE